MQTLVAPSDDERTWGMYGHLSGMFAFTGVPFGGIIGPLVLYIQNRHTRPFAAEQSREALNFHITAGIVQFVAIALLIGGYVNLLFSVSTMPKDAAPPIGSFGSILIGLAVYLAVYLYTFVLTLVGTIRASKGEAYRYPLTIRLVR